MKTRRLTRIVISAALSIAIILSAVASAFAQGAVIKGEPDGQTKATVIDEHFYSGSLEPDFTSESVPVKTDSYGIHFTGAYHYGSALVLAAYKLKKYNRFTFSIDSLGTNDGFIYCGFGGEDEKTTVSQYDFNVCFSRGVTAIYEMGGMDSWKSLGNAPLSNAFTVGKTTDIAVTLENVGGNNFKLKFEIIEDGEAVFSTDYNGATVSMAHPNGHFCMWGGINEKFNIREFKAYDGPEHVAFSDDFVDSSLTYGDEPLDDSVWHINEARFTRDEVFIARNAGPEFTKPGDTITAKNKLTLCDQVSKPYEISFNAKISGIEENCTFGLYLGAEKGGDPGKAVIVGISAYDDRFASVNLIKDGKTVDCGENRVPLEMLNIGETTVDFKAVAYSDHTLIFSIGDSAFTFNNVRYGGYWGICNYSFDQKSAAAVRLNEIKVIKNSYDMCAQPDLSNNFEGIKLTQDGFEEYYISDRTFYLGPGVSLRPKGAFTTEPSLYFENAGSYSAFGPKKPYTDFILQFDLKMVSEGKNSQWFGVCFGKESYASIADRATSINFEYYAWGTDPCTQLTANLCTFEDGTKAKREENYHFYKDQETKYNFMVVAKNRTVYLYYKEDSEDISKLGICRAVIPNVNTAGYVSIFGVSGVSFDIFNYKLINLAPEATGDSAVALRESFEKEKLSERLELGGSAEVKNGALALSGGSITDNEKSRYYIANFTVTDIKKSLAVSFAGNKSLAFSPDLKKITVNDGGKNTEYDVSGYNLSDNKNTQIQLILQYDGLSVAAKGVYDPIDKFASPIVEYTFSEPVSGGALKWTSNGATVDDIAVYPLDNSYKAVSASYEEDPNDNNIWVAKKNIINAENGGEYAKGIPTLHIVIYSVLGVIVLALSGVIVALLLKKRGKKQ